MRAIDARRGRRAWSRGILLAALVGLLPIAAPVTAAADDPVILRIGQASEDASVSPLRFSGWISTSLTYDMLAGADPDGNPVPAFAESWEVAGDGVTWTIHIRPGMTWSDGQPADASDVAFTIEYVKPATDPIWGGPYFTHWGLRDIESVSVVDDLTLTVVTKPPKRNWLPVSRLFVLPEHIWKDVSIEDATLEYDPALPSVGTGPYVLAENRVGQFRRYVRNESYWGPKPAIDEILLIPYKSADGVAAALTAGEIDIANGLPFTIAEELAKDPAIEILESRQNGFTMLAMNNSGKGASTTALTDPAFRDAIGYALDRATLVDRVFNGHATAGQSLVSPDNVPNYGDLSSIARTFDPAEAARRLDAAGYTTNADGARLDKEGKPLDLKLVLNNTDATGSLISQFVAGWLGELGIKVTPLQVEVGVYYGAIYAPDYDLDLFVAGYDANQFALTQGTSNANGMFFSNPEYDALWAQYTATYEPAAKHDLAVAMDQVFYQAAPGHVLVYTTSISAYRTDKFTGWTDPATPNEFTLMSMSWPMPMFARLAPVSAEASTAPGDSVASPSAAAPSATAAPSEPASSGGTGDMTLVLVIGAVAVAVIAILLVARRRRA